MAFSKSFPKASEKSPYTRWEEVSLTDEEERAQEEQARKDNIKKMHESIADAQEIMRKESLKHFQTDMITMAMALFEKRASHEIYYKESKAKEIFDKRE